MFQKGDRVRINGYGRSCNISMGRQGKSGPEAVIGTVVGKGRNGHSYIVKADGRKTNKKLHEHFLEKVDE